METLEHEWQEFARTFRLVIGEGVECTGRARIAFYCGALALDRIMERVTSLPDDHAARQFAALAEELERFARLMIGLVEDGNDVGDVTKGDA
ncbi:hypothetical protein Q8F57_018410 [Paraburkholderia terrae]|uniref:hypothetical protein n=1 Tax=Paraburkholderia terrae TaxID=311230 RepID=UPI00296B24E1|nr:hypothetical protein [Paraburkholderia terrae]MDW3655182.1 hypothetical protein [Paraburkholderia terrae]